MLNPEVLGHRPRQHMIDDLRELFAFAHVEETIKRCVQTAKIYSAEVSDCELQVPRM